MNDFLRIRNFEKFQHYRDRKPPWIKLYRDLWDDPRFFDLENGDRYLLIGLFVVASQHDNRIPSKQSWLKSQLLTSKAIPLQHFIDTGWLEPVEQDASTSLAASSPLAESYPSRARGETEKSRDREETEKNTYGQFANIRLTEQEHGKLISEFGEAGALERIEGLSSYVASKGKKYASHYATLLVWERKNGHHANGNGTKQHVHTAICREYGMCPEAMAEHNEQAKRSAEQWAAEEARRLAERQE